VGVAVAAGVVSGVGITVGVIAFVGVGEAVSAGVGVLLGLAPPRPKNPFASATQESSKRMMNAMMLPVIIPRRFRSGWFWAWTVTFGGGGGGLFGGGALKYSCAARGGPNQGITCRIGILPSRGDGQHESAVA
jgi:hypothetical protein